jgi:hypothetical protein
MANCLMREHVLDLLLAEEDVMYRVSAELEGDVFAVEVGWEEDFGVPDETLTGGCVRDESSRTIRTADIDDGAFLLGESGAQKARPAVVEGP